VLNIYVTTFKLKRMTKYFKNIFSKDSNEKEIATV